MSNLITQKIIREKIAPMFADVKKVGTIDVWVDEDGDQVFEFFYTAHSHNSVVFTEGYINNGKVYNQFNNEIGEL